MCACGGRGGGGIDKTTHSSHTIDLAEVGKSPCTPECNSFIQTVNDGNDWFQRPAVGRPSVISSKGSECGCQRKHVSHLLNISHCQGVAQ